MGGRRLVARSHLPFVMCVTIASLAGNEVVPQLDSDNLYFETARMKPIKVGPPCTRTHDRLPSAGTSLDHVCACFANEKQCIRTTMLFVKEMYHTLS